MKLFLIKIKIYFKIFLELNLRFLIKFTEFIILQVN